MLKADLRKAETDVYREEAGRVVERTMEIAGLNLQQFAAAVKRDERQVGRWCKGIERVQVDALIAAKLCHAFIQALAERAGVGVEIETNIRLRRPA